jgi:hypothetical protein
MNRLVRLVCGIALALTMGLMVAPHDGVQMTLAQEDGLGTPVADIETPPDKIETSDPLPWGLLVILAVVGIVAVFVLARLFRGSRRSAARVDRSDNAPPDNQRRS